jgi:hypothetical protein
MPAPKITEESREAGKDCDGEKGSLVCRQEVI